MSGFVAQSAPVSIDTLTPAEVVRGRHTPSSRQAWLSTTLALAATALLVIPVAAESVARFVAMAAVVIAAAAVVLAVRKTRAIDRDAAARAEEIDRARQAVLVSEQRYAALAE